MDNIVAGIFGVGILLAFIGGLAQSIGALPFFIIVAVVGLMAVYDLYETIRDDRNPDPKENGNGG
ncbi:MAG: hypothetical protein KAI73_08210 [Rhodospirillaceae bacterium]|nr:hypothetical protein [Rhodospirillaceae bacterium]